MGTLTGALLPAALFLFVTAIVGSNPFSVSQLAGDVLILVGLGVGTWALVSLTHLFLDALTMRGIYIKRRGKWQSWAPRHWPYDTPMNMVSLFIGFILLLVASQFFIGFL